ncbi:hypothetical protein Q31a_04270 [Aureliella helgolandensis]|uniref:Uncharacterized protein n=1 Tax=Aureliella helgolandensis TaxID=2527968 RepID=A0A518G0U8_9BACT|nr:hypothetical protein Q31a_04270 [Aureliella helgolandensis]
MGHNHNGKTSGTITGARCCNSCSNVLLVVDGQACDELLCNLPSQSLSHWTPSRLKPNCDRYFGAADRAMRLRDAGSNNPTSFQGASR